MTAGGKASVASSLGAGVVGQRRPCAVRRLCVGAERLSGWFGVSMKRAPRSTRRISDCCNAIRHSDELLTRAWCEATRREGRTYGGPAAGEGPRCAWRDGSRSRTGCRLR
jgi:hypothetical protein